MRAAPSTSRSQPTTRAPSAANAARGGDAHAAADAGDQRDLAGEPRHARLDPRRPPSGRAARRGCPRGRRRRPSARRARARDAATSGRWRRRRAGRRTPRPRRATSKATWPKPRVSAASTGLAACRPAVLPTRCSSSIRQPSGRAASRRGSRRGPGRTRARPSSSSAVAPPGRHRLQVGDGQADVVEAAHATTSPAHEHRPDVGELAGALGRQLAAVAAAADAAEGQPRVGGDHRVDEQRAGADPAADGEGALRRLPHTEAPRP